LNIQLNIVHTAIALARARNGKISEIITQKIGPRLISNMKM